MKMEADFGRQILGGKIFEGQVVGQTKDMLEIFLSVL